MEFGEQLKLLREAKGLTQAELAERVSVSRAAISLYEAGSREPRHSEVRRIAEALGMPRGFFDQDDLWQEVEEALAQARSILLGQKRAASGVTAVKLANAELTHAAHSQRDSRSASTNDSQLGATHVAGNHAPATDDFCSRITNLRTSRRARELAPA